jgi:predicted permease
LLFGLAPAWQSRNVDLNTALKENASKGGTARGGLRGALVAAEVALSLVLLIGAGLLVRTFVNLMSVEPGFDPSNVLTFQIALNGERYDATDEASAFYRDALERIGRLPGVEAAAVTNKLPLDWQFNMPVIFPDQPDKLQSVQLRMITPDYFRVMRIPVLQGRAFTDADDWSAPPAAIVNEAFVKRFFEGRDPFARQLSVGRGTNDPARQVVGVVGDVKQQGLDRPAPPMVYVPIPQMPDRLMAVVRVFTSAHFAVRATSALDLRAALKREIAALDATLALSEIYTMEEIAARSISSQRFYLQLFGLFAALGMLLAAVGIYGVMSYSVEQRTREIGLRMALGAETGDVLRLVVRQGMVLAMIGVALGIGGAIALTRLMESQLYGVSATDPLTYAMISGLIGTVALAACYVPARRAACVDPTVALRYE